MLPKYFICPGVRIHFAFKVNIIAFFDVVWIQVGAQRQVQDRHIWNTHTNTRIYMEHTQKISIRFSPDYPPWSPFNNQLVAGFYIGVYGYLIFVNRLEDDFSCVWFRLLKRETHFFCVVLFSSNQIKLYFCYINWSNIT